MYLLEGVGASRQKNRPTVEIRTFKLVVKTQTRGPTPRLGCQCFPVGSRHDKWLLEESLKKDKLPTAKKGFLCETSQKGLEFVYAFQWLQWALTRTLVLM